MRKLVALLIVLAPTFAYADKNYTGGKGATWDCKKDPNVNINHGNGTYTFKGACKAININGGQNKLTIESTDELNVVGGGNTVTVGAIDKIDVNGADNKIDWKKAKTGDKPTVNVVGDNNKINQAGGKADKPVKSDSPPTHPAQ